MLLIITLIIACLSMKQTSNFQECIGVFCWLVDQLLTNIIWMPENKAYSLKSDVYYSEFLTYFSYWSDKDKINFKK